MTDIFKDRVKPFFAHVLVMILSLCATAGTSHAQEQRAAGTISIEAEVIPGLEPTQGIPGAPGSNPGVPGIPGSQPGAQPGGDQGGGQTGGEQTGGGQTTTPVQPTAPTNLQVASSLMQSALGGQLSVADTSLVAAIRPGSRREQQNLDALVTVTVVDANGNVTNKSMSEVSIPSDVFGEQVGAIWTPGFQPIESVVSGGNILRRNLGSTYFYVQVCSCSL